MVYFLVTLVLAFSMNTGGGRVETCLANRLIRGRPSNEEAAPVQDNTVRVNKLKTAMNLLQKLIDEHRRIIEIEQRAHVEKALTRVEQVYAELRRVQSDVRDEEVRIASFEANEKSLDLKVIEISKFKRITYLIKEKQLRKNLSASLIKLNEEEMVLHGKQEDRDSRLVPLLAAKAAAEKQLVDLEGT